MKSSVLIWANARQSLKQLPNFAKSLVVSGAKSGAVFSSGAQSTSIFNLTCQRRLGPISNFDLLQLLHQVIVSVCRQRKAFCRCVGVNDFSMQFRVSNKSDLRYETVENWEWMLRQSEQKCDRVTRRNPGERGLHLAFHVMQARFNFCLKRAQNPFRLGFVTGQVTTKLLFDLIGAHPDCCENRRDRSDGLHPSRPFELLCGGNPPGDQQYYGCDQANCIQSAKTLKVCDLGCHCGIVA